MVGSLKPHSPQRTYSYSFLVEVEAIQPDCEGARNGSEQSLNSRIVGFLCEASDFEGMKIQPHSCPPVGKRAEGHSCCWRYRV